MRPARRPDPSEIERRPGAESVWDYPRPPRLEPVAARIRIVLGGVTVADTTGAFRVLETSHPPNYYLPPDAFLPGALVRTRRASWCEWKGEAHYYDVHGGDRVAHDAAWGYDAPTPAFAAITGHVACYAGPMDACFVGDEQVVPQPGGFYGGWITGDVTGPFKGGPGTEGW
jgi:uncharacterized protein (DUF427 family)